MYIFPSPYKVNEGHGFFNFSDTVILTVSDCVKNENALRLFPELWNQFTAGVGTLTIHKDETLANAAYLSVNGAHLPVECCTDYEYEVHVEKECIKMTYSQEQGLIHAFSTLLQMIQYQSMAKGNECFRIPCCSIFDRPAIEFRGIHLCVFPETTLDFLRKAVRMAGLSKYSHIVIEFWGMLKYEAMAELAWENAYEKAEIQPIIDDAHGFGMEVIPMFNHLGHATQSRVKYGRHVVLDQNPRYQLLFEPDGWTWCLSNPETLELLRNVRRELIELCGEGNYFHLGCDEAYTFATCPECSSQDRNALLLNYLNGLAEELGKQNRHPIIWGDALLAHEEWENPYIATSRSDQNTHEILDKLSKNIIIDDWQYFFQGDECKTSEYFSKKGFRVITSPWDNLDNVKALTKVAINNNLHGVLLTTWQTLHNRLGLILYSASLMWENPERIQEQGTTYYDMRRNYTAAYLRKLCPAKGDFIKAGWHSTEQSDS